MDTGTFIVMATVVLVADPCAAAPVQILDLTYDLDKNTQYWGAPYQKPPTLTSFAEEMGLKGIRSNNFLSGEHVGTHIDAPNHVILDNLTLFSLDQMPLENLFGVAVNIDVRDKVDAHNDSNYAVTLADVEAFETAHGRIPDGAMVFTCTGWYRFYNDTEKYYGGNSSVLGVWNHPGWSGEATEWLIKERKIKGIALDTPSCDIGSSKVFPSHLALLPRNLWCLENVARICELPPTGATVYALPLRIKGATGYPVRVMAVLGKDGAQGGQGGQGGQTCGASSLQSLSALLLLPLVAALQVFQSVM